MQFIQTWELKCCWQYGVMCWSHCTCGEEFKQGRTSGFESKADTSSPEATWDGGGPWCSDPPNNLGPHRRQVAYHPHPPPLNLQSKDPLANLRHKSSSEKKQTYCSRFQMDGELAKIHCNVSLRLVSVSAVRCIDHIFHG